jgi:thiol-disulfide isomerase/thioredoxin
MGSNKSLSRHRQTPLPFRKLIAVALLILILAFCSFTQVVAQTAVPEHPVHIYFFWGEGCPHCAKAKPFFESMAKKYPEVVFHSYEVYYDAEGQQMLAAIAAANELEVSGVPAALIGPYYLVGYAEEYNQDIENLINHCIQNGCQDAGAGLARENPIDHATPVPTLTPTPHNTPVSYSTQHSFDSELTHSHLLMLPIFGSIDLYQQSLTLSTVLIALVDGFNPCSLWVLSMLMALVIHTGSRKKVLLIGLIFLTVTAFIYALFIAGLFSVLRLVSFMGWVQFMVAAFALGFGIVNIKDYFWYKKGISFTISEKSKPGIFQRMRNILASGDSLWRLVGATVIMSAGVSLVEFSCTAGFPVLWTNLLVAQNVSTYSFVLLLLLYLLIYQLDELVIFGSMVVTLKASRLEEKQGRVLKLFGGILMLEMAVVMITDPSLMNNLNTTAMVFLIALCIVMLTLIIHRKILPKLGIWIGSEKHVNVTVHTPAKKKKIK